MYSGINPRTVDAWLIKARTEDVVPVEYQVLQDTSTTLILQRNRKVDHCHNFQLYQKKLPSLGSKRSTPELKASALIIELR